MGVALHYSTIASSLGARDTMGAWLFMLSLLWMGMKPSESHIYESKYYELETEESITGTVQQIMVDTGSRIRCSI